jgi:hypothetical protein
MEQTQTSILEMWWSLVQDQVGALNREIESLRLANAQIQARFAELLTASAASEANENSKTAALLAQELQRFHADLQVEREERTIEVESTREGMREELKRHADAVAEELRRERVQLQEALGEEVGVLKQELAVEKNSRCDAQQALAEQLQRLAGDVQKEHQNHVAEFRVLQNKVEVMGRDIEAEREEWTTRRSNLLGKILQHISDQEQSAKQERQLLEKQKESDMEELRQLIADSCAKERQFFERRKESEILELRQLVADICAKEREPTKVMLERARQILENDDALRQKLQALLQTEVVSKADFASEAQRLWQAIKLDSQSGSALLDLARVRSVPQSSFKPPLFGESSSRGRCDTRTDLAAPGVSRISPGYLNRTMPASSRVSSPMRTSSLQPSVAAPASSRGSSPVRTNQTVGQAVKLVTYRSPSAGVRSAVVNVDLPAPGGLETLRSVVSSVTTLPPSDDVLSSRSDLRAILFPR